MTDYLAAARAKEAARGGAQLEIQSLKEVIQGSRQSAERELRRHRLGLGLGLGIGIGIGLGPGPGPGLGLG